MQAINETDVKKWKVKVRAFSITEMTSCFVSAIREFNRLSKQYPSNRVEVTDPTGKVVAVFYGDMQ